MGWGELGSGLELARPLVEAALLEVGYLAVELVALLRVRSKLVSSK